MAGVQHQETGGYACKQIAESYQGVGGGMTEKELVFVDKCRKGGESATEADCQQKPHFRIQSVAAVEEPVQQTYYETSGDVYRKCAPGKQRLRCKRLYPPTAQVAACAPESAADKYC